MKKTVVIIITLALTKGSFSQDTLYESYHNELNKIEAAFSGQFYQYPNFIDIYKLNPDDFTTKIEEYKHPFTNLVKSYQANLDSQFIHLQKVNTDLFFDKFLLEYSYNHKLYTKEYRELPSSIQNRLKNNVKKFNNPEYLQLKGYEEYVKTCLQLKSDDLLRIGGFKDSDNKQLDSKLTLLNEFFTNNQCLSHWQYFLIKNHIENCGVKNIKKHIDNFTYSCTDTALKTDILKLYANETNARIGHEILTYKQVDGFELDMHLFLPDSSIQNNKKTAIIFFHGGGWTDGKPDWFFKTCKMYVKKGWVAASVEYRIANRHGTLPFESVKDAKSAIRWIRLNADKYGIDKNKIIASGNSAGGHLILCTALLDDYNESTDSINISAIPNLLMINSGVYDLTIATGGIWAKIENKDSIRSISPMKNIKKVYIPILMIHETNDNISPYWTADRFVKEYSKLSDLIKLETLNEAGHFIWFDPNYSKTVIKVQEDFLLSNGYQ
jgi:acetyl esterase/lipase